MSIISARATIIGSVEGEVTRKTVHDKPVAEFVIDGLGLRITAWGDLAAKAVAGPVLVIEGKLNTRTYQVEGKDRRTTEIVASTIEAITAAPATDLSDGF